MTFTASLAVPSLARALQRRPTCRPSVVTSMQRRSASARQWQPPHVTASCGGSDPRGLATRHASSRRPAKSSLDERYRDEFRPKSLDSREKDGGLRAGKHQRKIGVYFWACAGFGFVIAMYVSYYYTTYSKARKAASKLNLPQNADVSDRWKDRTRNFDEEVDFSEKLILMKAKRRRLANRAVGNVLEVSCGTGRNVDLYDLRPYDPKENEAYGRSRKTQITAITFNDQSDVMMERAEDKYADLQASLPPIQRFNGPVKFVVGDAGIRGLVQRPEGGFDTIIQTMGICSMANAPGFLRTMGQLCRQPGEASKWLSPEADDGKGGKILLLEHGRSSIGLINTILDDGAKLHANHYGCWWNKDIAEIIKQSGLEVERVRRYNFGTTYEYTLRPAKKMG